MSSQLMCLHTDITVQLWVHDRLHLTLTNILYMLSRFNLFVVSQ